MNLTPKFLNKTQLYLRGYHLNFSKSKNMNLDVCNNVNDVLLFRLI